MSRFMIPNTTQCPTRALHSDDPDAPKEPVRHQRVHSALLSLQPPCNDGRPEHPVASGFRHRPAPARYGEQVRLAQPSARRLSQPATHTSVLASGARTIMNRIEAEGRPESAHVEAVRGPTGCRLAPLVGGSNGASHLHPDVRGWRHGWRVHTVQYPRLFDRGIVSCNRTRAEPHFAPWWAAKNGDLRAMSCPTR